ncbi:MULTISPECIES: hypothetical protein [unclassified Mesorhizobium]|uniref:hypothetical protein n=1 Tax=unclassified Mesorhizobium TaxID=325217 RepID=UPI003337372A
MGRFAQLVREITPNWLHSRSSRDEIADVSPSDADFSWQEAVDNKMYGADTSDYSHVSEKPVSAKPTGDRPADENDRVPKKAN